MSASLIKYGDKDNRLPVEIRGLSTDEKPIDEVEGIAIDNGSVFLEIDTGDVYFFDADTKQWLAM